jgi:DNA replication protein DnaC
VTVMTRDVVSPDLRITLRALKLGQMLDTLPERLTLARQQKMAHADFLQLVLADEVTRREAKSAGLRARAAGLDAGMRLDAWDESTAVRYDRQLWNELASLRFLDGPHGALILGPVGVGKTHLAYALGHIAIRRRRTVHMAPAARLFKRLKAARLDNTLEAEMRRLAGVDLLILDDFALQPPGPDRDRRLLPALRRTPPESLDPGHLQPHRRGMAIHDGRPAARPVRRRPARLHRPRDDHRRRVLPAPPETIHQQRARQRRVR